MTSTIENIIMQYMYNNGYIGLYNDEKKCCCTYTNIANCGDAHKMLQCKFATSYEINKYTFRKER